MKLKTAILALAAASLGIAHGQNTYTFAGANGASWIRSSNWTGGTSGKSPGVDANASTTVDGATTDIAAISSSSTIVGLGINFNTGSNSGSGSNGAANQSLTLGAITFATGGTAGNFLIGNNSTTLGGVLTLTGVTVNSVANVILRNSSSNNLTLANTQGSGNKTMGVALGNSTDNQVVIDGSGGVAISSIVSGASRNLTLSGTGTGALTLSGANTYTGTTSVSSGKLVINGDQSAANGAVSVSSGATLGGSGTVGGATTVTGTLAAGNNGIGTQAFSSSLNFDSSSSIFAWELGSETESGRGTNFDAVDVGTTLSLTDSVFKVIVTGLNISSAFWDEDRTWDVFNKASTGTFSSFELYNSSDLVNQVSYNTQGTFAFDTASGDLKWQFAAIPEPSSALAGLLIAAGLLRRRRVA